MEAVELQVVVEDELPNHKVSSSKNKGSSSKYNLPPKEVTVVVVVEQLVVVLELEVVEAVELVDELEEDELLVVVVD